MKKVLKIGGIVFLLAAALAAILVLRACHQVFSPTEHPPTQVRELCGRVMGIEGFPLAEADALDHAWQSDHWLDSKLLSRMKTTPERVRALKGAILARDGAVSAGWKTTVIHTAPDCRGDEVECPHFGEIGPDQKPDWWKTRDLPGLEWFSLTENYDRGGVRGVNYVISEPEGLVFAEKWKT